MDQTTVYIPNVTEETQIGNSFSQLLKVIVESEAAKGTIVWDFNEVRFNYTDYLE